MYIFIYLYIINTYPPHPSTHPHLHLTSSFSFKTKTKGEATWPAVLKGSTNMRSITGIIISLRGKDFFGNSFFIVLHTVLLPNRYPSMLTSTPHVQLPLFTSFVLFCVLKAKKAEARPLIPNVCLQYIIRNCWLLGLNSRHSSPCRLSIPMLLNIFAWEARQAVPGATAGWMVVLIQCHVKGSRSGVRGGGGGHMGHDPIPTQPPRGKGARARDWAPLSTQCQVACTLLPTTY